MLAKNPPQSSRELLGIDPLGRVVRSKEPQRIDSVDPSINRVSRGGIDPISLIFFLSFPSLSLPSLSLSRATGTLRPLCSHVRSPSTHLWLGFVLAPPLCAVFLQRMRVKTLCHFRSSSNPSGEMAAEAACIPDP
jgi:hypothetical protein